MGRSAARSLSFGGAAGAMALCFALAGPAAAFDAAQPVWPDTRETRLAGLALVETLNAALLSAPSATLTLDRWCADHALARSPSKIVAERVKGVDKPADADTRKQLAASDDERIAYRRVRLTCGNRVLSEADNWYRPALLTEAMNHELETTDTSFGRVVKPLGFTRTTLSAELLWRPLPDNWEMLPAQPAGPVPGSLAMPHFLLSHRAILKRADGQPFSLVAESYTSEILAFPAPIGASPQR